MFKIQEKMLPKAVLLLCCKRVQLKENPETLNSHFQVIADQKAQNLAQRTVRSSYLIPV